MFSLESPHRGDSYEYTQPTIIKIKKENHPKCLQPGFFYMGLKKEFEIDMVKEPSVLEPLKFYCNWSFATPTFITSAFSEKTLRKHSFILIFGGHTYLDIPFIGRFKVVKVTI